MCIIMYALFLLREWSDCKEWLLNIFSGVVGRIEDRKSPPEVRNQTR